MNWDRKVFIHKDGRTTQLIVNDTGEIVLEVSGLAVAVKQAWQEHADKYGMIVLNEFDGKIIYQGK